MSKISNQDRINTATDTVIDYMYKNEDKHFRENLDEEDLKNSACFVKKIREHIFYSLVILKYKGDAKAINEWLNEYWSDCGGGEDSDDEEEPCPCKDCGNIHPFNECKGNDEEEKCCDCRNFGDDGCKCDCHSDCEDSEDEDNRDRSIPLKPYVGREENAGICGDCKEQKELEGDRVCHRCYHFSVPEGDCWCATD